MQWIHDVVGSWWFLPAFLIAYMITFLLFSGLRPAGDHETLLRRLPPRTTAFPQRLAQLRRNARHEARNLAIGALWYGVFGLVAGSVIALSTHPVALAGFGAAVLVGAFLAVGLQFIGGIFILGRYLGARRRVVLDARGTPPVNEITPD